MSGTVEGGYKCRDSNINRHGKDFYERIGAAGGSVSGIKKGFALMSPERRREVSRLGGHLSKRTKKR